MDKIKGNKRIILFIIAMLLIISVKIQIFIGNSSFTFTIWSLMYQILELLR